MLIGVDFGEALVVDAVDIDVGSVDFGERVEIEGVGVVAGEEFFDVTAAEIVGAECVENFEVFGVVLAVLVVEITDGGIEVLPRFGVDGEIAGFGIGTVDGRELEKVTTKDDLETAKGLKEVGADFLTDEIDEVKAEIVQHGDFVDDENVGFLEIFDAGLGHFFEEKVREVVVDVEAAPRMDGVAAEVSGG